MPQQTSLFADDAVRPAAKRKRKLLTQLNVGYTRTEIEDTLRTLLALSLAELEHVCTNPKSTAFEVTIARAVKENAAKGNIAALESLLLRLFGKPGSINAAIVEGEEAPEIIQPTVYAGPR